VHRVRKQRWSGHVGAITEASVERRKKTAAEETSYEFEYQFVFVLRFDGAKSKGEILF
jgi:hypothetical protein